MSRQHQRRPRSHRAHMRNPQRMPDYRQRVNRQATRSRTTFTQGPIFGVVFVVLLAVFLFVAHSAAQANAAPPLLFQGTTASPHVHVAFTLNDANVHPQQLAYDAKRNGIWFWTSEQQHGVIVTNTVYFYNLTTRRAQSWPIYAGDWSSQLLSGIAVAPDGSVWVGWNHNLVRFQPTTGAYVRYILPAQPQYPLPAAVVGNIPTSLGIADLAVGHDGTVWIARYAALSLTAFHPASATFTEYPLPATSGDPAKLAIAPDGDIVFTTDLAADHPGYSNETVGDFDPHTGQTLVLRQFARSLTVTATGDLYAGVGQGQGVARLDRGELDAAHYQPLGFTTFQQGILPFDIDNSSIASDAQGRLWVAVAGQPDIALYTPASGAIQQYQYAAPSVAAHPVIIHPVNVNTVPADGSSRAVRITRIVAMLCDARGDLWYIRAGSDALEEVTP